MTDDRKQYRAPGLDDPSLRTFMSRPGEDPVPCQILDASVGGIGVFVTYEEIVHLDLGLDETAWFRLESRDLREPIVTPGVVRRKTAVTGGIAFGIAFVDWLGFLASCPSDLRTLFNQRAEYRATFEPGEFEFMVDVGEPLTAWLRDLSPYGLNFEVDAAADDALSQGRRIGVALDLPDETGSIAFSAVVLHIERTDRGFLCGACFDVSLSRELRVQRESVERFLARRQRQSNIETPG